MSRHPYEPRRLTASDRWALIEQAAERGDRLELTHEPRLIALPLFALAGLVLGCAGYMEFLR